MNNLNEPASRPRIAIIYEVKLLSMNASKTNQDTSKLLGTEHAKKSYLIVKKTCIYFIVQPYSMFLNLTRKIPSSLELNPLTILVTDNE
jgi:hypothetical protein